MRTLSNRLETLLALVPRCSLVADIGADHAHLTLALLERGITPHVLCTDLSPNSLDKAKRAVGLAGRDDAVTFSCGDGLAAIRGFSPDAIVIAGMGGETIAEILNGEAPREQTCFLLQPMSRASLLRRFLNGAGYRITEERLAKDAGRIYPVFSAVFDPSHTKTESELDLVSGLSHFSGDTDPSLLNQYLTGILRSFEHRRDGRRSADLDTAEEDAIISALKHSLSKE